MRKSGHSMTALRSSRVVNDPMLNSYHPKSTLRRKT
jgi:hypothetical protein